MRARTLRCLVAVILLPVALGCGVTPPGEEVRSSKERITSSAPAGDVAAAVAGNTDFALALHQRLVAGSDDNLFFSPQSITLALAQAWAGAGGATATAFQTTLHQTLPEASYHRAMNDLDRQLMSRGQGAKGSDGKAFRLDLTNQLFADKRFVMKAPFLDTLAQEYGAGVQLMDFQGAPEPARVSINDWVAAKTEDRIKELLAPGSVDAATPAVLVNAIYFNAAWKTRFDIANTSTAPFHALDGSTRDTLMMHAGDISLPAALVDGVEVVALPYDGDELSMLVLMPPADFADFEARLTAAALDAYVAALQPEALSLSLPRFEHRAGTSLKAPLEALGLGAAFSGDADFSEMTDEGISIADVVHQAFVKVSEGGTEAAAATAVTFERGSVSMTRTVSIDRPFVYVVRDDATGAVVFLGRYVKP